MKSFKELGIKPTIESYVGDKIKITKILNKEISVLKFKIEPSKYQKGKAKDLMTLQIEINDEKFIIFTASIFLINQILQIDKNSFPFNTIISKIGEHYEFT